jgi:ribosome-binding protein aMBF1 (putative translation factor)
MSNYQTVVTATIANPERIDGIATEVQLPDFSKEELKSGRVAVFQIESFNELPTALIKARIALGMTQKELAEKIDTQEQQIQRYEANHYHAISFDRLMKIVGALGISFKHSVEIELEPLESLV